MSRNSRRGGPGLTCKAEGPNGKAPGGGGTTLALRAPPPVHIWAKQGWAAPLAAEAEWGIGTGSDAAVAEAG